MIPRYLSSIAPAVANHLWQSTLFALLTAVLALALRTNHARVRHHLWLAASLKFLLPFSLMTSLGAHLATLNRHRKRNPDFTSCSKRSVSSSPKRQLLNPGLPLLCSHGFRRSSRDCGFAVLSR